MPVTAMKLPDIGEGVAEVELAEWLVRPGDIVREDDPVAAVMTDKATVEIPSLLTGRIVSLGAEIGEMLAVGAVLVTIDHDGAARPGDDAGTAPARPSGPPGDLLSARPGGSATDPASGPAPAVPAPAPPAPHPAAPPDRAPPDRAPPDRAPPDRAQSAPALPAAPDRALPDRALPAAGIAAPRPEGQAPLAAPAVRKRARDGGIDLRQVRGTGRAGRITDADLDAVFAAAPAPQDTLLDTPRDTPRPGGARREGSAQVRVLGLRRKIADRMSLAHARIPHITVIEEVDVTALDHLREALNAARGERPRLTVLPLIAAALCRALADHPEMNAHFDDEAGIVTRHRPVHLGIATQTEGGLMVPVLRHAESLGPFAIAAAIARLAEAARAGKATREELGGSTFTVTSLGPLGAIATTPIINHPEVAILGVNRIAVRPFWDGSRFVPRRMMNLSASFDHRVVDGWDAARFVQRIKGLLETPALIFMEPEP